MTKRIFNLRNVAMIACLAGLVMFSGCKEDDPTDNPIDPEAPAITEFSFTGQAGEAVIDPAKRTVKATAACGVNIAALTPEFTLTPEGVTAKVDGNLQISGTTVVNFSEPVTYILTTTDGKTAEWKVTIALPNDCPTVKKYITYNQPVTAYYIEYTEEGKRYAEAYENKEHAKVFYWDAESYYTISYRRANGTWLQYSSLSPNVWLTEAEAGSYDASQWVNENYKLKEYPMGRFAGWVSIRGNGSTSFIRNDIDYVIENDYVLPNHTEVTQFYKRSEMFLNINCDVFEENYGGSVHTFWVDLSTGFTLKYKETKNGIVEYSFEVTNFKVSKPDWDDKHLHPIAGDDIQ